MSLLGYPELCSAPSYRTHCYLPVTPVSFCSSDVSTTFGHYLPSSCQSNLWLLDGCQESSCETHSAEPPSLEPKSGTACPASRNSCNVPSSAGQVISACGTTHINASPKGCPGPGNKGYVSNCHTPTPCASKACQTLRPSSTCQGQRLYLSKNLQPQSPYRLSGWGYTSYRNVGFLPNGFSSSCYAANSYPPQRYFVRYCPYRNYGSVSCRPLTYLSRHFRSLSCIPSTFPPLRYLCSGSRPLNCY
ncbi:keratin-associated protein 24-1 [Perognathus longimembris pacificus]|uniref:keratin-associated protein 24-1 n=1 Tax=Perognathus longimembris pacificus TaxID=214514 RepID=UPI00201901F1|nr:keratin-associated protein 24-1 [Perognathus longimembris pacificus]